MFYYLGDRTRVLDQARFEVIGSDIDLAGKWNTRGQPRMQLPGSDLVAWLVCGTSDRKRLGACLQSVKTELGQLDRLI